MARCFPPNPSFGDGRHGERVVWEALTSQLPDDAAVFYSQLIIENGREYEIDFLVVWPGVGIATIEVKGGHVERDSSGHWSASRGSDLRPVNHPMVQSSDSRHAFQRMLKLRGATNGRARMQHLVALPHMRIARNVNPPDCPRNQVIDAEDLRDVGELLSRAIERGDGHEPATSDAVDELVALLNAPLEGGKSLQTEAEEHEQRVEQLTRDQTGVLQSLRHYSRLAVIGGAGTGKTWLALEQARRLSASGQRVALVCYSRGLGRFLQRTTSTWPKPPAYVGLFHDLPLHWGAPGPTGEESDYYETELPVALGTIAAQMPGTELFDAVVVDEAQDFGDRWWDSLLLCLRDPAQGGVYVFMDEAQRVFSRRATSPIDIPPFELCQNIRNTKRIAQVFGSLASSQMQYGGLEGPPVWFAACDEDQACARADEVVDALLDEWPAGNIALLTTRHRHNVHVSAVELRGWQAYWDDFFNEDEVFYGHVLGFKGLERPVVVLAANGFRNTDRAREMLYVGLSRARTQLVVCGSLDAIAAVGGEGVRRRLQAARTW